MTDVREALAELVACREMGGRSFVDADYDEWRARWNAAWASARAALAQEPARTNDLRKWADKLAADSVACGEQDARAAITPESEGQ